MFQRPRAPNPWGKKLLLIGEAPGEEEEKLARPFIGTSGKLLDETLKFAGLDRDWFHITNVFSKRPPENDLKQWTITKTDLKKAGFHEQGRLPPLERRYLHPSREPELLRLQTELHQINPDFILLAGGKALWSIVGDHRITQFRGSFFKAYQSIGAAEPYFNATCLATFHPAVVLRQWDLRPIVWADFMKAKRFLDGTLEPMRSRRLWINPTFEEMWEVLERFRASGALLGVDIETDPRCGQMTTIAFATPDEAICIPLWDKNTLAEKCNVYEDVADEARAWMMIMLFAELPNPKVLQNGMYDMQYLLEDLDIRLRNVQHDTAILQHATQPELKKDLGTLASIFLNEPSWKFMRESNKDAKADE